MSDEFDALLAAIHQARVETSDTCSSLLEGLDDAESRGFDAVPADITQQRILIVRHQRMFMALASAAELLATETDDVGELKGMLADVLSQGLGG